MIGDCRPPISEDYYPRYTDHCSLIAQRVSIRNLLSVYSPIYSHYCCYILIHCASCTQVDHPPILYPCTNHIYFFQTNSQRTCRTYSLTNPFLKYLFYLLPRQIICLVKKPIRKSCVFNVFMKGHIKVKSCHCGTLPEQEF